MFRLLQRTYAWFWWRWHRREIRKQLATYPEKYQDDHIDVQGYP